MSCLPSCFGRLGLFFLPTSPPPHIQLHCPLTFSLCTWPHGHTRHTGHSSLPALGLQTSTKSPRKNRLAVFPPFSLFASSHHHCLLPQRTRLVQYTSPILRPAEQQWGSRPSPGKAARKSPKPADWKLLALSPISHSISQIISPCTCRPRVFLPPPANPGRKYICT